MLKSKKYISLFLVIFMLFTLVVPAFASDDDDASFNSEKAQKVAVVAAKSKMTLEGISTDISGLSEVTRVKFDKENSQYIVTVRAQKVYKYTCVISKNTFFGKEVGVVTDSVFEQQSAFKAFFAQGFEKAMFFFARLFKRV